MGRWDTTTDMRVRALNLTLTDTHTHSHILTLKHTVTQSHPYSYSHSPSITHSHIHSHIRSHTHTVTHTCTRTLHIHTPDDTQNAEEFLVFGSSASGGFCRFRRSCTATWSSAGSHTEGRGHRCAHCCAGRSSPTPQPSYK